MREYPALKPQKPGTGGKRAGIYLSEGAKQRLSLIYDWIRGKKGRGKEIAQRIGVNSRIISQYVIGYNIPSLWIYLHLMELFNFNCELDINYTYATMKYSREEIRRRVTRIAPREYLTHDALGYKYISDSLGLNSHKLYNALTYYKQHSIYFFVQGMYFISQIERRRGYDDAMVYEI